MQHRMKTYPLDEEQIETLLANVETGTLATLNPDGTPYATPIHFVYHDNMVYFHGLPKGRKLENIARDNRVSFTAYHMDSLLLDTQGKPCDTNTKYQSVILSGTAAILEDLAEREEVLHLVVAKYTPHLKDVPLSGNMLKGTAVIGISVGEITGKYYE